jgi:hypothetical protein
MILHKIITIFKIIKIKIISIKLIIIKILIDWQSLQINQPILNLSEKWVYLNPKTLIK